MFCPTCGSPEQSANAYCKRCGDWLPELKGQSHAAFGGDTPQQNIVLEVMIHKLHENED